MALVSLFLHRRIFQNKFLSSTPFDDIDKSTLNKNYYYFDKLSDVFDFVAWFVVINVFHQSNASIQKIFFRYPQLGCLM